MEYIIPNVLRGKLKSENILCKKCNNYLSAIDKKLASNFEFLNIFFKTKQIDQFILKFQLKLMEKMQY